MNETNQRSPEKRRTKRVIPSPDQPVHVELKGSDFIEGTTAVNVSQEGIGISVPHGFKGYNLDEVFDIIIKLPEPVSRSFSTTAKVIHHQGNNFGVQFENLETEDKEDLWAYIDHRLVNTDSASLMKMLYGV
ncbi:MAG: PilZ domain-containing protein [Gammaproteobacteria bacterium]|nr:PilZ domain-containing protein [Gammaproteobacteria bacterium]